MHFGVFVALGLAVTTPLALAQGGAPNLADLSLEDLANLSVTSVSGRAERLSDAPASIYVITGEDIRRSGVTSLPEALRLAPNLQVARTDARNYAISARGFNSTTANKLLVLIDGRSIYTPLFSGVFWDAQDAFLDDVERIEVISGPGATLWGANAVNGVINIITRSAAETKGLLAYAGTGNREDGVGARYGTAVGGGAALRVYGKAFDRQNTIRASGADAQDGWRSGQGGFRADWGSAVRGFTLQGDAYQGTLDQVASGNQRISGRNLLGRWTGDAAGGSLKLQAYYDNTDRSVPGQFAETLDTYDLSLQHVLKPLTDHVVTWGGGHRYTHDQVTNSPTLAFLPAEVELRWSNLFAQDEIALGERLRFTAGAKAERNSYTGWEYLPSARLAWKRNASSLLWTAASRAVRSPARLDRDTFVPANPPFLLAGGPDFRSEISNVFELGYRDQPLARASYSTTAFYAKHKYLRSLEPTGAGGFVIGNKMKGHTYGLEAWGNLQARPDWRLTAGALFLRQHLEFEADSGDTNIAGAGNDPKTQLQLRSAHDLPGRQEVDLIVRYVSELPSPRVPAYTALDLRYAIRLQKALELSLTGQNLFDRRHPEFGSAATRSEIDRGVFLRVKWAQ